MRKGLSRQRLDLLSPSSYYPSPSETFHRIIICSCGQLPLLKTFLITRAYNDTLLKEVNLFEFQIMIIFIKIKIKD